MKQELIWAPNIEIKPVTIKPNLKNLKTIIMIQGKNTITIRMK